jgi:hypothetical protein
MRLALTLIIATFATPVLAQRPDASRMSCHEAATLVKREGAVVMGLGGQTYDRLVRDDSFCAGGQYTQPLFSPTLDNRACLVGWFCKDREPYDD